jgi:hypothetical protein
MPFRRIMDKKTKAELEEIKEGFMNFADSAEIGLLDDELQKLGSLIVRLDKIIKGFPKKSFTK